ncbi:MAG TPA: flavodoxin-dependent (E)-4-hydroxy-3-methylbut-2-enyl-diphosphate synthase [Thermodesulfobacteriota bacterium]|nr:flavodoxin-dependent (E)-4-hydroxy-3-methylbut-2-enyl-diphosphate synthase [Thermodesulfobacteriota bacterium]
MSKKNCHSLSLPEFRRRKTHTVSVGRVVIGHGHPIVVQSMTNTDTRDIGKTVRQINRLAKSGCELIRVAVPDGEAAQALKGIVERSPLPVIADIHFDHRLALQAMKAGAAGIRINPGNIGARAKVIRVIEEARDRGVCIRIGVNAGSLEKDLQGQGEERLAEAMVTSALRHIELFEQLNFMNLKISLKASDVLQTIRAYQGLAPKVRYPFHLGVTEAGTLISGTIKSALGIGLLLYQGIGDTVRVSLTAPPQEEIRVAFELLRNLKLRERGVEIISCPTCGRCRIDLIPLVRQVERAVQKVTTPLKVAIMGCVVNGPGEAREADIGIAGGKGQGLLFARGRLVRWVREADLVASLLTEIEKRIQEKG